MLDLGKLFIPTSVEYKPGTGKITFQKPESQIDYYLNDNFCNLVLEIYDTYIHIDYSCNNDTFLSHKLYNINDDENLDDIDKEPDLDGIAHGDLTQESFREIQNRALKKLAEYMENPHQGFAEHFEND